MINIGELKERIEVIVKTTTIDENTGIGIEKYINKYTLRCKRKTISSKEFYENNRESKEVTDRFICRKRDITLDDMILYKNERYNIKHINEIGLDFVELTATKKR